MRRSWILIGLLAGCVGLPQGEGPQSAMEAGTTLQLKVVLPQKAARLGVQKIDVENTQSVKVSVWGPGNGTTGPITANISPVGNPPTATVTVNNVPAGKNRIIKVEVYSGTGGTGSLYQTLYGLGDLNHGEVNTVPINWGTTPTGFVFDMVRIQHGAHALTTDRVALQNLVTNLLAGAHGGQIDPEELWEAMETRFFADDPDVKLGFSIPAANDPLVANVVKTAASGNVLVFDLKGQVVSNGLELQLHDPVTSVMTSSPYGFSGAVPNFDSVNGLFQARGLNWVVPTSWNLTVRKTDDSRKHQHQVKLTAGGSYTAGSSLAINLGGVLNDFFGNGTAGSSTAQLNDPRQMAMDAAGNLYVADRGNHRILKITPGGAATVLAGTGAAGGPALSGATAATSQLRNPEGVAVGPDGTVYIADTDNHLVFRLPADGKLYRIVGTGVSGNGTDSGLASTCALNRPRSVAFGVSKVWVHDSSNAKIRRVDVGSDNTYTLVIPAGNGTLNANNPGLAFNNVSGVDLLYYAKGTDPILVRRDVIGADQELVVAGTGSSGSGFPLDDGVVATTIPKLNRVTAIAADAGGNVFFADAFDATKGRIRWSNFLAGPPRLFTVAGNSTGANYGGNGVLSTSSQGTMGLVWGMAIKQAFSLTEPVYVGSGDTGSGNHRIRKLAP